MTDEEIALSLGIRILNAKLLIDEMNLELNLARETHPLRRSTEQILKEAKDLVLRPVYRERIGVLRQKLHASTADAMLGTLQESLDELLKP
jgi:hypothetical protein